jgi:hypothetical protein
VYASPELGARHIVGARVAMILHFRTSLDVDNEAR